MRKNNILASNEPARLGGPALAYFRLARKADSDAALAQFIKSYADYEAFKCFDRACAQKDLLLYSIKYRTESDKQHADPRYKAFLKKMNLPE